MRGIACWGFTLVCVLVAAACGGGGDSTGLLVLVEDCSTAPQDLTRVRVRVRTDTGHQDEYEFELGGSRQVPFSFGIAPGEGGKAATLIVTVEAFTDSSDTSPAVTYTATDTGFIDGKTLLLDVCLGRSRTEARPPSSLEPITPGEELMRDGGTPLDGGGDAMVPDEAGTDASPPVDAAMDAGTGPMDGGPTDGGDAGATDAGLPDATTTCMTECGSTGTCTTDCSPSGCEPPSETCNGEDDDCDGLRDEDFGCVMGETRTCQTVCGSTGTVTCSGGCEPGSCVPPAEICGNNVDDDCDTQEDEGCMPDCGTSCTGAMAVTSPGGRFDTSVSGGSEHTGSCGGDGGPERVLTFDLQTASDVFVTTHGSGIDTVLYVRSCNCSGPEEACNDDADGQTTSALQLTDVPGGTYTVFADTKAPMTANIQVDIHFDLPSALGDRCSHPRPFDEATESGNTCGATSDNNASMCDVSDDDYVGPDHVYYVVVDSSSSVRFDTCAGCTTYDTSLDLRSACDFGNSSTRVACSGDECASACDEAGGPPIGDVQSRIETPLEPGVYYLTIDGWGSDPDFNCGAYEIVSSGLGL